MFNLTQSVVGSTHVQGHTLDLVLSWGILVCELAVENIGLSDHYFITFNMVFSMITRGSESAGRWVRPINTLTASEFAEAFKSQTHLCDTVLSPLCSDLDILVDSFNSECSGILDSIAPFKKVKSKTVSQPWFNAESHLLRQKWRQAERRWKSDKLQVSYEILRDCLHTYQLWRYFTAKCRERIFVARK